MHKTQRIKQDTVPSVPAFTDRVNVVVFKHSTYHREKKKKKKEIGKWWFKSHVNRWQEQANPMGSEFGLAEIIPHGRVVPGSLNTSIPSSQLSSLSLFCSSSAFTQSCLYPIQLACPVFSSMAPQCTLLPLIYWIFPQKPPQQLNKLA